MRLSDTPATRSITRPVVDVQMEAVHIDQTTLSTRPGYSPTFLGTGPLQVPLPKLLPARRPRPQAHGKPSQFELKYFTYSVVLHKERKLAIFAAVNTDGGQQQDVGKREGDTWFLDPRVDVVMEAFFSTVKNEVGERFTSHADAKAELFDYLEVFFNQRRRHSSAGRMSPAAFGR
ncbi:MAG: IS3 family transposase [Vicinamibacterales bacterium]